jgi:hypothetical protein
MYWKLEKGDIAFPLKSKLVQVYYLRMCVYMVAIFTATLNVLRIIHWLKEQLLLSSRLHEFIPIADVFVLCNIHVIPNFFVFETKWLKSAWCRESYGWYWKYKYKEYCFWSEIKLMFIKKKTTFWRSEESITRLLTQQSAPFQCVSVNLSL